MKVLWGALVLVLVALGVPHSAHAQYANTVAICVLTKNTVNGITTYGCDPVSAANPFPTTSSGGGGGGLSVIDEALATYGTSPFTPSGCFYFSSVTNLASGTQGAFSCDASRELNVTTLAGSTLLNAINAGVIAYGSAIPTTGIAEAMESSGNAVPVIQADASAPISISSASTVQIVAAGSTHGIDVTGWDITAGGSTNVTFEYGTGSTCGGGTIALTGAIPMVAGQEAGRSGGIIWVIPAGNNVCEEDSTTAQISGSISFTKW